MLKEDELIFSCLTTVNEVTIKKLATNTLDWEYILNKAKDEGVMSIIYYNLEEAKRKYHELGTLLPQDIMLRLKDRYIQNLGQNIIAYDELNKVLRVLAEDDIVPIVLKGASLATTIYDNIGLRPFGDIDLLIKKEDLEITEKKLIALGYYKSRDIALNVPTTNYELSTMNYKGFHLPLYKNHHHPIEIHWDIHPLECRYKYSLADAWRTAEQVKIGGIPVLALNPENTILHLLLHIARAGLRLIWCVDIVRFIEKNTIDWRKFIIKAEKNRVPIYQTLIFIEKNFSLLSGKPVLPEDIQREIKILVWIQDRQLQYISRIWNTTGVWNKIRAILIELFPDKKSLIKAYKINCPQFIFFYYIIRLAKALFRILVLPYRIIFSNK